MPQPSQVRILLLHGLTNRVKGAVSQSHLVPHTVQPSMEKKPSHSTTTRSPHRSHPLLEQVISRLLLSGIRMYQGLIRSYLLVQVPLHHRVLDLVVINTISTNMARHRNPPIRVQPVHGLFKLVHAFPL